MPARAPQILVPASPPFIIRLTVTAITALISSSVTSFIGLALNYGLREDFLLRWLKILALGYLLLVPLLMMILPLVQRLVVGYFIKRQLARPYKTDA